MLKHTLLRDEGILIVTPTGPLGSDDFAALVAEVDPYIEKHGMLRGLMVVAADFPDWKNFDALVSHLRFVRDHHERIRRVALVTDSAELTALEGIAEHFVDAELEHFPMERKQEAHDWLRAAARAHSDGGAA